MLFVKQKCWRGGATKGEGGPDPQDIHREIDRINIVSCGETVVMLASSTCLFSALHITFRTKIKVLFMVI